MVGPGWWCYFINKVSLWFDANLGVQTLLTLTGAFRSIFLLAGRSSALREAFAGFMAILLCSCYQAEPRKWLYLYNRKREAKGDNLVGKIT